MGLLDDVRTQAAATANSARFVSIDASAIDAYAQSLPLALASAARLDPATHYAGEPEATQAYVVTLDAINFGSGYFPHLRKRAGMSGYFTVASSLKDLWESRGPLSARDLGGLSAEECARVFGQSLEDPAVAELMSLFAQALNDPGDYVGIEFGESFSALVADADGSAENLVY